MWKWRVLLDMKLVSMMNSLEMMELEMDLMTMMNLINRSISLMIMTTIKMQYFLEIKMREVKNNLEHMKLMGMKKKLHNVLSGMNMRNMLVNKMKNMLEMTKMFTKKRENMTNMTMNKIGMENMTI